MDIENLSLGNLLSFCHTEVLEGGAIASNLQLINGCFMTISSQIFTIYILIFHKTEVQTVILRCLVYLYLDWIKSYDMILVKKIFF